MWLLDILDETMYPKEPCDTSIDVYEINPCRLWIDVPRECSRLMVAMLECMRTSVIP